MSLVVWLPLTKDLRNQGLASAYKVGSNTATLTTGGKLGGCYNFTATTGSGMLLNNDVTTFMNTYINNHSWSLCAWIKNSVDNGDTCVIALTYGLLLYGGSSTAVKLYNSTRTITCTSSVGTGDNQWHHLVATYNVDTNAIKIYVDGINTGNATYTSGYTYASSWTNGLFIGRDPNNSTANAHYFYQGQMNDVRIYDHCLSLMEVKELSKGLILHYPLNRGGFGQDNLMPNSIEMPVGSANPSTGTWRLAGSSQMTRSRVAISDAPSGASTYGFQSVGLQTGQDASCWGIDGFPRENGVTYTLSAWGRIVGGSSTAAMLGFSIYSGTTLDYGGTYGKAVSSDAKYYGSGAYDYAGGQLNPNGNWTRIYRTFTSTSASDNIYIGFNTAKIGSNVTLQLCGVKLEKGEKMTPWVPNSDETMYTTMGLNGIIEYDCSGYCNNGTKNNITYTSDTPKYAVGSIFNGSNSYIKTNDNNWMTKDMTEMTVNLWAKATTWPTNGGRLVSCTETGGFNLEAGNSEYWRFPIYVYTNNERTSSAYKYDSNEIKIADLIPNDWNMITLVYDNTGTKTYLNGELHHTYTSTSYGINFNTNARLFLGCEANTASPSSPYFNGIESDFRIYATALSADDVKSLYQNSAYIDSSGNVYGAVHSEV